MASPIDTIMARLDTGGHRPTKSGNGWRAFCPVHEADGKAHKPSLSIDQGDDGRALICCRAGCQTESIVKALGMGMQDLFPATNGAAIGNGRKAPGKIEATYDYRDERGELLFQVVRYKPKDFRQRRPEEGGGWNWSVKGVRQVPYRLPELLAAEAQQAVLVVEGEKDAGRLAKLGLVATTNAGGAGKWKPELSEYLKGRRVVVLPDNDEPGRQHAEKVAGSLFGVASSLRIVHLPGLAEKGDVSDWLDHGGTRQELLDLVEATPEWKPTATTVEPPMICLADIQTEEVRWLWAGRIALGKLTFIQGDPDLGKSFLTLDMAARVSTGRPWPGDASTGQPAENVFLLSAEDGVADTIRPRLEAAGANLKRVFFAKGISSLTSGLSELDRFISRKGSLRLLVIDPLSAYLGKTDSHKNAEVRGALAPLVSMAERHQFAVVCVTHLNKNTEGPAIYRATGSLAFTAAARAVWQAVKDKENPQRRLLLPVKNNLARDTPGLAYRIVDSDIPGIGKVEWEPDPVSMRPDEALFIDNAENESKKYVEEAVAWLREELLEGPLAVKEVQRRARDSGHTWHTIRRAREKIGAESKRQGFGGGGVWYWVLPNHRWPPDAIGAIGAQTPDVGTYGKLGTYEEAEHLCPEPGTPADSPPGGSQ